MGTPAEHPYGSSKSHKSICAHSMLPLVDYQLPKYHCYGTVHFVPPANATRTLVVLPITAYHDLITTKDDYCKL